MKKKKKFFKRVFVFFISILILISISIITFYIALNNLPFISKKVFNRNLKYSKVNFSLINGKLEIENVVFSAINNNELFKIKKIIIDLAILKTISFSPTIDYFYIEGAETYVVKDKDNYIFPKYLDIKSKTNNFSLPFAINHIEIKNGTFKLKDGIFFLFSSI